MSKLILSISDLHLGAGKTFKGKRNPLEDFHLDDELVEFLDYYSSFDYAHKEVELIINGDFFDLLSIPFVNYFDDQYWMEQACLDRLIIAIDAHKDVMDALIRFVEDSTHKITYIIGNHDAEMMLPSLKDKFLSLFREEIRGRIVILEELNSLGYVPVKGLAVKHGHEYEPAHFKAKKDAIIYDNQGRRFFVPAWGSYFITKVLNKYKAQRDYVNLVRPIGKYILHALIFDTFFAVRVLLGSLYFLMMVRFISLFKIKRSWSDLVDLIKQDLVLFTNLEDSVDEYLEDNSDCKVLLLGHTHDPFYQVNPLGATIINSGCWIKLHQIEFAKRDRYLMPTYAHVEVLDNGEFRTDLFIWRGHNTRPYDIF